MRGPRECRLAVRDHPGPAAGAGDPGAGGADPSLTPEHLVVSTATAVPMAAVERATGEGVPVVRTLLNSMALLRQGVTPVTPVQLQREKTNA